MVEEALFSFWIGGVYGQDQDLGFLGTVAASTLAVISYFSFSY